MNKEKDESRIYLNDKYYIADRDLDVEKLIKVGKLLGVIEYTDPDEQRLVNMINQHEIINEKIVEEAGRLGLRVGYTRIGDKLVDLKER